MVNVSKGLIFKTTTLHLGVIPEVILNLFCVVFLGIKTRTRICLLLPSFGQKKDVCLVQWCTHTSQIHRCWPFIKHRNTHYCILHTVRLEFWRLIFSTKTLFCDIKINSTSFEQENSAVWKYPSTDSCITERDVQKHKNRGIIKIHCTTTKEYKCESAAHVPPPNQKKIRWIWSISIYWFTFLWKPRDSATR